MPISYKHKIYTTLGTPTDLSGDVVSATDSAGVPAKDYTVKGKTIVWNQLLDKSKYPATTTINGVTFTNNGDGTITANGTATENTIFAPIGLDNPIAIVSGHKFLFISCPSGGHFSTYFSDVKTVPEDNTFYDFGTGVFSTTDSTTTGLRCNIRVMSGYTANNLIFKPQLFDLTQMFGAGNEPATPEEFWSYFNYELYPYNAGELKTIVPTSIEASGIERFQLLDKSKYPATTTTNGVTFTNNGDGSITVNGTADSTANGSITIAENLSVIQGHKYYATMFKLIEHRNFWLGLWASPAPQPFQKALVILDQNGQILTCVTSSDKLHVDITLYKTTSVNNATVKPQLFDLTQMFGAGNEPATPAEFWQRVPEKLYGYNPNDYKSANIPSSKYFPDGMKSAGSVYDEINFLSQKAIKRIDVQNDISTFPWQNGGSHWWAFNRFRVTDLSWKPATKILCAKYEWRGPVTDATMSTDIPNGIYCSTDANTSWINIKDSNYSTTTAFKSSIKDVPIYYELETPVETAITPPLQALQTFNGFTSFSSPNSLMQNGPLSVTYYAEGGASPEKGWLTSYKRKLYMGRTIEWNQLLGRTNRARVTHNGVTVELQDDGSYVVNGTATDTAVIQLETSTFSTVTGHKYFVTGCPKNGSMQTFRMYDAWSGQYIDFGDGVIFVASVGKVTSNSIAVTSGYTCTNLVFKPQLFDLTQMFGAGNEPSTPEEFWFYFDHKLYPYNAGETQPLFKISRKSQWGSATVASLYVGEDIIIPQIVRN